jgi:hypothetical protein
VFEKVFRRIFRSMRVEVVVGWRRPYNEELHNLFASPYIVTMIKKNEIGEACSMHGIDENAYKILVRKPEGKRPYRRSRH